MDFGINVKVDPNGALPQIKRVEDGLTAAEKKAKEMSRELSSGLRHVGGAFGELANAIEMETRMLERATGQSRDFGQQLAALDKLHRDGRISAEQYVTTLQRMGVEFGHTADQAARLNREQTDLATKNISLPGGEKHGQPIGTNASTGQVAGAVGAVVGTVHAIDDLRAANDEAEQSFANVQRAAMKFADANHTVNDILHEQWRAANDLRVPVKDMIGAYDGMRDATKDLGLSHREVIDLQRQLGKIALLENPEGNVGSAVEIFHRLKVAMSAGAESGKLLKGMMLEFDDISDGWVEKFGGNEEKFLKLVNEGKVQFHDLVDVTISGNDKIDESWRKRSMTDQEWRRIAMEAMQMREGLGLGGDFKDGIDRANAATEKWQRTVVDGIESAMAAHDRYVKRAEENLNKDLEAKHVERVTAAVKAANEQLDSLGMKGGWDMGDAIEQQLKFAQGVVYDQKHARKPAIKELDEYAEALKRIRGPGDDAIKQLNIIGQLHMNGRISLKEYTDEYARLRNILVDLDRIPVKSMTNGIEVVDYTAGLSVPKPDMSVDLWKDGAAARTQRWHDELDGYKRETEFYAKQIAAAWTPVEDSLKNMFKTGEFELKKFGEAFDSVLVDIGFTILKQAALMSLFGGSAAPGLGGALFGALGGGMNGFDHLIGPGRNVPGFKTGTDAMIGGRGPQDSQLISFWGSPGESLHVRTPQQRMEETAWARESQRAAAQTVNVQPVVMVQNDPREVSAALGTRHGLRAVARVNRKFGR